MDTPEHEPDTRPRYGHLGPDHKAIFDGRVFDLRVEGKRPQDIAEILDVPLGNVLSSIKRIGTEMEAENRDIAQQTFRVAMERTEQLYLMCRRAADKMMREFDEGKGDFKPEPIRWSLECVKQHAKMVGLGVQGGKPPIPELEGKNRDELLALAEAWGVRVPPEMRDGHSGRGGLVDAGAS